MPVPLSASDRVLHLPYRGAPSTCAVIRDAALRAQSDYIVRQFTEEVCQGLRSKDYLSEILAIGHFVETRTRYMRDPRTVELVRSPRIVLQEIAAGKTPGLDCDDMTALIDAMLLQAGCQCAMATFAFQNRFYNGERQYSHVAAVAIEPRSGAAIVVDPVAGPRTTQMLQRCVAMKLWPVA